MNAGMDEMKRISSEGKFGDVEEEEEMKKKRTAGYAQCEKWLVENSFEVSCSQEAFRWLGTPSALRLQGEQNKHNLS